MSSSTSVCYIIIVIKKCCFLSDLAAAQLPKTAKSNLTCSVLLSLSNALLFQVHSMPSQDPMSRLRFPDAYKYQLADSCIWLSVSGLNKTYRSDTNTQNWKTKNEVISFIKILKPYISGQGLNLTASRHKNLLVTESLMYKQDVFGTAFKNN